MNKIEISRSRAWDHRIYSYLPILYNNCELLRVKGSNSISNYSLAKIFLFIVKRKFLLEEDFSRKDFEVIKYSGYRTTQIKKWDCLINGVNCKKSSILCTHLTSIASSEMGPFWAHFYDVHFWLDVPLILHWLPSPKFSLAQEKFVQKRKSLSRTVNYCDWFISEDNTDSSHCRKNGDLP